MLHTSMVFQKTQDVVASGQMTSVNVVLKQEGELMLYSVKGMAHCIQIFSQS